MNPRLKQLMKELECALGSSLSRSARLAQVIAKINDEGFDAFLVLEATVGLCRKEKQEKEAVSAARAAVGTAKKNPETAFTISTQDERFLKSLRISVDETR